MTIKITTEEMIWHLFEVSHRTTPREFVDEHASTFCVERGDLGLPSIKSVRELTQWQTEVAKLWAKAEAKAEARARADDKKFEKQVADWYASDECRAQQKKEEEEEDRQYSRAR